MTVGWSIPLLWPYNLANLIAVSFASAPELQKKDLFNPDKMASFFS